MCGRVVTSSTPEELSEYLGADEVVDALAGPDHNVPPTGRLPLVWEEADAVRSRRLLGTARWGLVPPWADDPSVGSRMFNARAETVAEKPSFRAAFRRRRCLVPVDGFYEWGPPSEASRPKKQAWYVQRADGDPLALAGLWEDWEDPEVGGDTGGGNAGGAGPLRTCTVITLPANGDLSPIHHRMPALLPPEDWPAWLDPGHDDRDALSAMLRSAPEGLLERHPVSGLVGNPRNKGPELLEPVAIGGPGLRS